MKHESPWSRCEPRPVLFLHSNIHVVQDQTKAKSGQCRLRDGPKYPCPNPGERVSSGKTDFPHMSKARVRDGDTALDDLGGPESSHRALERGRQRLTETEEKVTL